MDRLFNRHGERPCHLRRRRPWLYERRPPNVVNLRPRHRGRYRRRGGRHPALPRPGAAPGALLPGPRRAGSHRPRRLDEHAAPGHGQRGQCRAAAHPLPPESAYGPAGGRPGASAITIYLFLGYNDHVEAVGVDSCARFVNECRDAGLPCTSNSLGLWRPGYRRQYGGAPDPLGARSMRPWRSGRSPLKIPYTANVRIFPPPD